MNSPPNRSSSENSPSEYPGPSLEAGLLVGGGRYLLRRLLRRGTAGPVWVAWDEQLGEELVLKFIPGPLAQNGSRLEALRREIGKARRLNYPNLVRVFDLYHLRDEPAFVSMEYVPGITLDTMRLGQPRRVFSWSVLQPFIRQLCATLEYAHGEGLVHGALRPTSLILDDRGRLRIADLGLARLDRDTLAEESPPNHSDPRIAFMSPQLLAGETASVSDDVYALGATLYGLLSGTPPFQWNVGFQVRKVRPQAIGERIEATGASTDVPALVAALIMACLAKESDQRPDSARTIREGIEAGGSRPTELAASPALAAAAGNAPAVTPVSALNPGERPTTTGQGMGMGTDPWGGTDAKSELDDPSSPTPAMPMRGVVRGLITLALIAGLLIWGWMGWEGQRPTYNPSAAAPAQPTIAPQSAPGIADDIAPRQAGISEESTGLVPTPLVRILSGHRDAVNSVAFSPDSRTLASGSFDSTVRRWNGVSGNFLDAMEGHQDRVESVAFAMDGTALASGSRDRTVKLWDFQTGELRSSLDAMKSTVFMVAFSPDGQTLACAEENGEVSLWDPTSGSLRQRFRAHDGSVWSIAFSPDGRTLASGGVDRRVRLWNATNGVSLRSITGHTEAVHSVAFSPDGSLLASSGRDRTIRIWRAADGRPVRQWTTDGSIGHALAFARRGPGLVSANEDGSLSIWSAATGKLLTNKWGHSGVVHSVSFSPDGAKLASGGHDHTVRLWDWELLTESLPELSEFIELFNGRDLTGWRGDLRYWTVQDGLLTGSVSEGESVKTFLVWTGESLGNFELRFVFRSEAGNSGISFRAQEPQPGEIEGYQYELWSDQTGGLLDVRNSGERRDLALPGQRTVATDSRGTRLVHLVETLAIPSLARRTTSNGGWNEGVIIAEGNRMIARLNGQPSAMVLDIDSTRALSQGLLALELYSQGEERRVIQFQRIRLRRF